VWYKSVKEEERTKKGQQTIPDLRKLMMYDWDPINKQDLSPMVSLALMTSKDTLESNRSQNGSEIFPRDSLIPSRYNLQI